MIDKCKCGNGSQVIETRKRPHYIWRRRRCTTCRKSWTTAEIVFEDLQAIKQVNEIRRIIKAL